MMMKISTVTCLMVLLLHGGLGLPSIEPSLMKTLQRGGAANVLVTMRDSTSSVLEGFSKGRNNFATRGDRITTMVTQLQELAGKSQANVISFLKEELSRRTGEEGFSYRSFWISNQIFVRGASQELLEKLGAFNEIESIAEAIDVRKATGWTTVKKSKAGEVKRQTPRGWSIARIGAPEVWSMEGINGTGTVIATIDTGVRGSHEALRSNYRHSHGWYDVYTGTREPSDDFNHGTHVMGTIVGSTEHIGVAPGSQWITCKACSSSGCGLEAFIQCGQWVLCPTDYAGGNRNCSMAPHVVNNILGFTGSPGGSVFYKSVTDAWHAAGIISVFPAGDQGRSCGSLSSPADYENVLGVGATDCGDHLTEWSGVGPSQLTSGFKPDVVAPGVYINSAGSYSDTDYWSGDSSAFTAPHVTGTVALMLASRPRDRPCFESVREALRRSSVKMDAEGLICSGVGDHQQPNYHHGYGLIDALGAVRIYRNMTLSCP